jgi:hypothetical protein
MEDEYPNENKVSISFLNIRGSVKCLPEFSFFTRIRKCFIIFLFYSEFNGGANKINGFRTHDTTNSPN